MYNLATRYKNGEGVERDYTEAMKWYKKAYDLGNGDAANQIGIMYANGRGVAKNYAEAAKWYKKSADAGFDWGKYNLAKLYERGQGVEKNDDIAFDLYMHCHLKEARERLDAMFDEMFK